MFFVLSGYLFTNIFLSKKEINYKQFITNRVLRILPLFVIILSIIILTHLKYFHISFLPYLLTLNWNIPFFNGIFPSNLYGFSYIWTIAVEFQFYILFPLLFRNIKISWILIFIILLLRSILYKKAPQYSDIYYFSFITRFSAFIIGMYLALFMREIDNHTHIIFTILSILLLYTITNMIGFSIYRYEIIYFCIAVFIFFYIREKKYKITRYVHTLLQKIGVISYSFYLTHIFAIKFSHILSLNILLASILSFILTMIISIITYKFIEKPFMKLRKKY